MQYSNLQFLREAKGIVVVFDNSKDHNLRTIPFFISQGFHSITYPGTWRIMNNRSYNVFNSNFFLSTKLDNIPDPFLIITSQEWEDRYPFNSILPMIRKANKLDTKLIVCCDTKRYQISRTHRPLIEQEYVRNRLLDYKELFIDYQAANSNFIFPLTDSLNVFLQKCASILYDTRGVKCRGVYQLHKEILEAPENPLWDFWSILFKTREGYVIPVEFDNNRLSYYVQKRFEISDKQIRDFIHDLRGPSEKYLDPQCRVDIKNLKKIGIDIDKSSNKIKSMYKEFGLRR